MQWGVHTNRIKNYLLSFFRTAKGKSETPVGMAPSLMKMKKKIIFVRWENFFRIGTQIRQSTRFGGYF